MENKLVYVVRCVLYVVCCMCVVSIELGLLGIVLVKYYNKLKSEILGIYTKGTCKYVVAFCVVFFPFYNNSEDFL